MSQFLATKAYTEISVLHISPLWKTLSLSELIKLCHAVCIYRFARASKEFLFAYQPGNLPKIGCVFLFFNF